MVRKLPYGDVTEEDVKKFRQIEHLLELFQKTRKSMEPRVQAKCLLSFAYEYIMIGMDEVSDSFLMEAESICPDYFEKYIIEDMDNPDYEKVCFFLASWYENYFKPPK